MIIILSRLEVQMIADVLWGIDTSSIEQTDLTLLLIDSLVQAGAVKNLVQHWSLTYEETITAIPLTEVLTCR
jgi:hypothetical protein